jgi:hypothetical protein
LKDVHEKSTKAGLLLPELAVDLKLFCGELSQHLMVTAAVGFGDEGAKLTLAAFELAALESFERIFDTFSHGLRVGGDSIRVLRILKGAGQKNSAGFVGCSIEGVRWNWGMGERFE